MKQLCRHFSRCETVIDEEFIDRSPFAPQNAAKALGGILGFLFVSLGSRVASSTHGFNGGRLKRTGATTFSVPLIRKKKNLRIRSLPSCDRATIRAQKRLLEFHKPLKVHSARYFDPRPRPKSLWTGYVMQEYCRSEFRSSPIYQHASHARRASSNTASRMKKITKDHAVTRNWWLFENDRYSESQKY